MTMPPDTPTSTNDMTSANAAALALHPTSRPESQLSVPTLLHEVNPKRVYLIEMPGNHGDKLSYLGILAILNAMNIRRTFNPNRADVILLMGQATITDMWGSGVPALRYIFEQYPDKPLIVLPSSFHFTKTDFSSIFENRTARCVLMARDTMSWDVLQSCTFPTAVELYCDHDLAFYLQHSSLLHQLKLTAERTPGDYVLIVERRDREHHADAHMIRSKAQPVMPSPLRLFMKSYLWAPKQGLHRLLRPASRSTDLSDEFRHECEQILAHELPEDQGVPWTIGDVSSSWHYSFREFCSLIAQSRAVLTSRLHVGILAAMLGKPTFLRAGRYGKLPGVHKMSMYDWPNVKLFGDGGEVEDAT